MLKHCYNCNPFWRSHDFILGIDEPTTEEEQQMARRLEGFYYFQQLIRAGSSFTEAMSKLLSAYSDAWFESDRASMFEALNNKRGAYERN